MKLTREFMLNALTKWLGRTSRRVYGSSKYTPHQGEQEKARRRARMFPHDWSTR